MRQTASILVALGLMTVLMGCPQPANVKLPLTDDRPATEKAKPVTPKTQPTAEKAPVPVAKPQPVVEKASPAVEKAIYRVNCGGEKEYVDAADQKWAADCEYSAANKFGAIAGETITRSDLAIPAGTKAIEMYRSERYSMTGYRFDVPSGKYTVRLHFAEAYEEITAAGLRVFTVKINGQVVLKDFDVFKEAGGFAKPLVKEFKGVTVTDGKILIEFEEKVQNPQICGIEILQ